MIVVRDKFRIRFGQMKDALASMNQLPALVKASGEDFSPRVLTDVSGPFYTLVLEMTFEDLGTYDEIDFRRSRVEGMVWKLRPLHHRR
mgnify:CR=1 FL=1